MDSGAVSVSKRDRKQGRQSSPEQAAAAVMVAAARDRGLELTGPDGLLKLFIKNVLETALDKEITEHLGHEGNRVDFIRTGEVDLRQLHTRGDNHYEVFMRW